MLHCVSCHKFVDLKTFPDGSIECPTCGRVELPRHMRCARCGFVCLHVEAGGIHGCPNCGIPKQIDKNYVKYEFDHGCDLCNLPGHMPKPGYMEPVPAGHPRAVFGLAPGFHEKDVEEIMEE